MKRPLRKIKLFLWILSYFFVMIFPVNRAYSNQESLYNPQGKRDPFLPLISQSSRVVSGLLGVETLEEIVIEGVVYDPGKGSIVVANGAVLKEGETLGSVTVLKVRPDGAFVSVNGSEGFRKVYQEPTDVGTVTSAQKSKPAKRSVKK